MVTVIQFCQTRTSHWPVRPAARRLPPALINCDLKSKDGRAGTCHRKSIETIVERARRPPALAVDGAETPPDGGGSRCTSYATSQRILPQ